MAMREMKGLSTVEIRSAPPTSPYLWGIPRSNQPNSAPRWAQAAHIPSNSSFDDSTFRRVEWLKVLQIDE